MINIVGPFVPDIDLEFFTDISKLFQEFSNFSKSEGIKNKTIYIIALGDNLHKLFLRRAILPFKEEANLVSNELKLKDIFNKNY